MLPLAWTPCLPPLPPVARLHRAAEQLLELSPAPSGFASAEDFDGSLLYQGDSVLCQRLENARIEVLAVRHGQSESNAQSETLGSPLLYGQTESPLTEKGRHQAEVCAQKLYQELGGAPWLQQAVHHPEMLPVLLTSDLSRAQETAVLLKQGLAQEAERLAGSEGRQVVDQKLDIISDPRLRETHFGRFETRPLAELESAYPDFVSHWRPDDGKGTDFRHRFPGGESRSDVMSRVGNLLESCCGEYPNRTLVLVSHGETLLSTRALLGKAPVLQGKVVAETGKIPNATPFWLIHHNTTFEPGPISGIIDEGETYNEI